MRKNRQVRQFVTLAQDDSGQDDKAKMNDDNNSINEDQLQELDDLAGTAHVVQFDLNFDDDEGQPTGSFATTEDSDNQTA